MSEKVNIEDDDIIVKAVYFSKHHIDGTADDISDNRIARRIYQLLDVEKALKDITSDRRLINRIWDKRRELQTINSKLMLRYGDRGEYDGTKASKRDIQERQRIIDELKKLEASDVSIDLKDTLKIADIYSQLPPTSNTFPYRIYRVISEPGWSIYAEERVENPRLMLVMDKFDLPLAKRIFSRFIDLDEEVIQEEDIEEEKPELSEEQEESIREEAERLEKLDIAGGSRELEEEREEEEEKKSTKGKKEKKKEKKEKKKEI